MKNLLKYHEENFYGIKNVICYDKNEHSISAIRNKISICNSALGTNLSVTSTDSHIIVLPSNYLGVFKQLQRFIKDTGIGIDDIARLTNYKPIEDYSDIDSTKIKDEDLI